MKSILRKCVTCKLVNEKAFIPPKETPLPGFRVDYTYSFETVGIDYVSMFHKFTYSRNLEMKKCYLLLITCTSAVYLEVTTDLNANSFFVSITSIFLPEEVYQV